MRASFLPARVEPVAILGLAAALAAGSRHEFLIDFMNALGAGEFWLTRRLIISQTMKFCACAMAFLFLLSLRLAREGGSLTGEFGRCAREAMFVARDELLRPARECLGQKQDLIMLAGIFLAGVAVRWQFVSQPMRFDESMTYLDFARGEWWRLFNYPFPNNHVLHSMLVRISTALAGSSPAAIRLPAFIFGILAIPLAFLACRIVFDGRAGILSAAGTAMTPNLVLFSTNARGYTLYVFLFLIILVLAAGIAKRPGRGGAFILSVLAALGMWNMPVMLFPLAGVGIWILLRLPGRRVEFEDAARKFIIPAVLMTVSFTILLYLPVVIVNHGISNLVSNSNVSAQSWATFGDGIMEHIQATAVYLFRGVPMPARLGLLMLAAAGFWGSIRHKNRDALMLLPALAVGAGAILIWKQRIPFLRVWLYFVPIILFYADFAWAWMLKGRSQKLIAAVNCTLLAGTVAYGWLLMDRNAVARYADTGAFPEAESAVLKMKEMFSAGDAIRAEVPANYPLYYYLAREGMQFELQPSGNSRHEFYVIQRGEYDLDQLTDKPATLWWESGDALIYMVDVKQK